MKNLNKEIENKYYKLNVKEINNNNKYFIYKWIISIRKYRKIFSLTGFVVNVNVKFYQLDISAKLK